MFQPVTLIDFFADFETRSRADLKKVGTVKYATDPSTEATLLTYAFSRTGPVKYWRMGQPLPIEVIDVLVNPHKYKIIAHNLFFDYLIWTIVFSKLLPAPHAFKRPEILNLEDNMALTTYYRFGSGLDAAATLMRMPYSKDKEGKRVMLKQCKPGKDGNFPVLTPEEEAKFIQYGLTDTRLMRDIYYQLPPLPAAERWAWEWTFKRNLRGIRVDVALLNEMKKVVDETKPLLAKEFEYWTCNQATVSSPTTCLPWFRQFWPWIENMQADTIRDMFADTRQVPHHARRALELKELAGSTSISKVEVGVNEEYMGRLFGLFSYAYTFTRRWAGRGIQIQNFPRVDQKPYDPIIEDLNVHDLATPFKRRVALGLKDPIGFVKNHLRRIWIPDEGKEFLCGDFSKIEPTVLYWLVGKGAIPDKWYEEMAAEIFNKKVSEIDKHGEERQLGKAANLGCSYGLGHAKFKATVFKQEGVNISEEMAKRVVDTYRRVNKEVVELWTDLENAFRKACLGHSSALCGNKIHVMPMRHPWKGVVTRLPSGNHLYYHYAQIEPEAMRYQSGEKKGEIIYDAEGREKTRDVLTYASSEDGILSRKKVYGGLLTEHVVSCTARDILVPAMWRLEDAGFDVLACIHDEAWAQAAPGREEDFKRLMCINPSWCQDMKIGIGEEIGVRYLK